MAHWRDSARAARFFIIDYRGAFPILFFLLHIRLWTLGLTIFLLTFFYLIERYGITVPVFVRWFRNFLAGPRKYAVPWWRKS